MHMRRSVRLRDEPNPLPDCALYVRAMCMPVRVFSSPLSSRYSAHAVVIDQIGEFDYHAIRDELNTIDTESVVPMSNPHEGQRTP